MKADLSKIPNGNYILKLKQGSKEAYIKIKKHTLIFPCDKTANVIFLYQIEGL
jgi:hypothetical protein